MDRNALNSERLAKLSPRVQSAARRMIEACEARGVHVLVTQGLRTWEEQKALYEKGRRYPGKIVTNAPAGRSWHNFGVAFDVVPVDDKGTPIWDVKHPAWSVITECGKAAGLEWGGEFRSFKDIPHWQFARNLKIFEASPIYNKNKRLQDVWDEIERRNA